jgi:single-strand DNA-binding protein
MINQAMLIGIVDCNPTIRDLANGNQVANFTLVTEKSWKQKDGTIKRAKQFHWIAVFDVNVIETIRTLVVGKGSRIVVQGEIESRTHVDSKTGEDKTVTEIVLRPRSGSITVIDLAA